MSGREPVADVSVALGEELCGHGRLVVFAVPCRCRGITVISAVSGNLKKNFPSVKDPFAAGKGKTGQHGPLGRIASIYFPLVNGQLTTL